VFNIKYDDVGSVSAFIENNFLRDVIMGAGTFHKVVRLEFKNERHRREDRGAEGVWSGEVVPPSLSD